MIIALALFAAAPVAAAPAPVAHNDGVLTTCIGKTDPKVQFLYVIWGRPGASEATIRPKSVPPVFAGPVEFTRTRFSIVRAPNKPDGSPNPDSSVVWDAGEGVLNQVPVKYDAMAKVENGKLGDFLFTMTFPDRKIEAFCGQSRSAAANRDELK